MEHYHDQGYELTEVGKPYDLRALKDGDELHVEVKGSSQPADDVELTINEVRHAIATAPGPAANSLPRTTAPANRASTLRNSLLERLSTRRIAGTTLTLWQPVSLSLTMSG